MNFLQKTSRRIIKLSFDTAVSTIERFSNMDPYHKQVDDLRKLNDGTLGKEIANCLDEHQLTLVPRFESHDLKHVLLDYKMTPEDEIRMQAFMIGNGNYSIPSFAIMGFGGILLPDLWKTFYADFQKGRATIPVSSWTIDEFADKSLDELQAKLAEPKPQKARPAMDMKRTTQYAAMGTVLAGVFGMMFCLPYLFSSNMADLVGAGFPFVGGAILVVGGLMTMGNLSREKTQIQS